MARAGLLRGLWRAALAPEAGCRASSSQAGARTLPYQLVSVEQVPGSDTAGEPCWQVLLDGRRLKTPAQKPLWLATQHLALAVAAEWQWQDGRKLMPITMPLMTLACTAIDQPKEAGQVVAELLEYLHSDTALCLHHSPDFAARQEQEFAEVRRWAERRFGAGLRTSDSILGAVQSDATTAVLRRHLEGLDAWRLAGLESLVRATKSFLLGTAVAEGELGAEQAVGLARLEEATQAEEWGWVEGGHDTDLADMRVRVLAPALFLRLLRPA